MWHRRALAALLLLVFAAYPARRASKPRSIPAPAAKQTTAARRATPSAASGPAQRWLSTLSLHDKVAQLVMITAYGDLPARRSKDYKNYIRLVQKERVGGIIVVNRVIGGSVRNAEPYEMVMFLNRMQKLARLPLLVGADFERGASMRVANTAKFPHLMAYGAARDLALTRELGKMTAAEARALGVQWVFAPDADVNNNPENPIINIRSFGENPDDVAAQVKAFIEGAHAHTAKPVLVTAKHFPGHGDTAVDSHMGLAALTADRPRMDQVELVPFRAAIAAGVDSVMTAHMAVPAIEKEPIPATVSRAVITDLLRNELKFNGLIVTDAMDMQGLAAQFSSGEAAVRAIEAGVDMLLMPPKPEEAIKAVVAAVKSGRIPAKRIDQSVAKVLAAKVRVGLHRSRYTDPDEIVDVIADPDFAEKAQLAADRAVTLVKNEKGALPLRNPAASCLYILTESRHGQQGRRMLDEARTRAKSMRAVLLDPQVTPADTDALTQQQGCETNIVATFASVGAYRGTVGLSGNYPAFVDKLLAGPAPVVMISLGNPYLLRSFPGVQSYVATFSPVPTSEVAAVKVLLGEITPRGRLPVSIPGIASAGDGVTTAAN